MARLQLLFSKDFDEKLSDFQAISVIDLIPGMLGPAVHKLAVKHVFAPTQVTLDHRDGEVFTDGDR